MTTLYRADKNKYHISKCCSLHKHTQHIIRHAPVEPLATQRFMNTTDTRSLQSLQRRRSDWLRGVLLIFSSAMCTHTTESAARKHASVCTHATALHGAPANPNPPPRMQHNARFKRALIPRSASVGCARQKAVAVKLALRKALNRCEWNPLVVECTYSQGCMRTPMYDLCLRGLLCTWSCVFH